MPQPIRVLLADDHAVVRKGIREFLEEDPGISVVAEATNGQEALRLVAEHQPQVAVLDVQMPVLNGIDAARVLKVKFPQVKVVFITMHADPAYVRAAFEAGASAYLLKRCVGEELGQAIRAVRSGNFYVTPLVTKDVVESMLRGIDGGAPSGPELTTRQREVLQLLAEGHTVKDIAGTLKISPRTVEFHKGQIMEQLNLHTTVELVKYALAQGLTSQA